MTSFLPRGRNLSAGSPAPSLPFLSVLTACEVSFCCEEELAGGCCCVCWCAHRIPGTPATASINGAANTALIRVEDCPRTLPMVLNSPLQPAFQVTPSLSIMMPLYWQGFCRASSAIANQHSACTVRRQSL